MLLAASTPAVLPPFQRALEGFLDLADELLLVAAGPLHRPLEHAVAVGIQRAKAQVLELQFHGVQAEPFGHGSVDIQGFARDAPPLDRRHGAEGAHVVHAVGELDHDDADVAHHRKQHLAEALGLGFLTVLELDLVELLTPSTSSATTCPNIVAISAFAVGVSSMTSCRIAATSVSASSFKSARMSATATGWVM